MQSSTSRLRTPANILENAASVLAEHRNASMNDIAVATGVGRATLYRYFPTRKHLLDALSDAAVHELATRIDDAGLDRVPVREALRRLSRATLAVGDHFIILVSNENLLQRRDVLGEEARRVLNTGRELFQRGVDDGTLRDDLEVAVLQDLFSGLVVAGITSGLARAVGLEDAAALVESMFVDGARRRAPDPDRA